MSEKKEVAKELKALVRLLDEPDEELYAAIRNQVLALGMAALPFLEEAENQMPSPQVLRRIEEIIHAIRVTDTYEKLKSWSATRSHNLLEAWILISTYLSPDDDREKLEKSVDKLYRDIWVEMNPELTALEKIRVVNHVFYSVYQYDGLQGKKAVMPPYLLGNVLRMQRGNPLSLALLYLIIVQRLGMPVFGVNLPRHLILAYTNGTSLPRPATGYKEEDVLFYVNPFNKGAVFRKSEIELYLKQLRITPQAKFFLPCDNKTVIKRLLQELITLSGRSQSSARVVALNYFLKAVG